MMNTNQLQTIPMSVERRLMQLEGDKDTLQLQVMGGSSTATFWIKMVMIFMVLTLILLPDNYNYNYNFQCVYGDDFYGLNIDEHHYG